MGHIVDISKHQGEIDWAKASKEIDLAIIRVQYGSTTIDSKYKEYVAECKKYGIPFGFYAYCRFVSVRDAEVEAKDFLNRIDKEAKFLVADVEEVTTYNAAELVPATQKFIDVCKAGGYKTGLYSGQYFYTSKGMAGVRADFLWIARYSDNAPVIPYDLWQYTDKGKVAGITQNTVDLNKLAPNRDLGYFIGYPKVEAPAPAPVIPKPVPSPVAKTHIVVSGDTLWELAIKYKTTVAALKLANRLKNDTIYVGQTLKVSAGEMPKTVPATYHTVRSGDTVSELAIKYRVSQAQIRAWNGLNNRYTIYIGQKLRVK